MFGLNNLERLDLLEGYKNVCIASPDRLTFQDLNVDEG
jgi:hypothetical protein